jgi:hypothetical protein
LFEHHIKKFNEVIMSVRTSTFSLTSVSDGKTCFSAEFLPAQPLREMLSLVEAPEASSRASGLDAPTVQADIETLIMSLERLGRRPGATPASSSFITLVNSLEVEGFIPPLLSLLIKKNSLFLNTPVGKKIFESLAQAVLQSLARELGIEQEDGAFFTRIAAENPERFLQWMYCLCLHMSAKGEKPRTWADLYSNERFDLKSTLERLEMEESRAFLFEHLKQLLRENAPVREVERRLAFLESIFHHKPELFKAHVSALFSFLEGQAKTYTRRLYFRDLSEKALVLSSEVHPAVGLAMLFKAEALYQRLTEEVQETTATLQAELVEEERPESVKEVAHKVYSLCIFLLKDRTTVGCASETQEARQLGLMTRAFRQLDDAFSRKAARPLHHFCGCHLRDSEEPKGQVSPEKEFSRRWPTLDGAMKPLMQSPRVAPTTKNLQSCSVLTFSCNYGGGHNVVQEAYTSRYGAEGAHVYNMDGEEEVFRSLNTFIALNKSHPKIVWAIGKLFGYDTRTDATMYNSMVRLNQYGRIQFIKDALSGETSQKHREQTMALTTRAILSRDPDLLTTSYVRSTHFWAEAARRTGRPMHSNASDFAPTITTEQEGAIQHPHFKHSLFMDTPEVRSFLTTIREEESSMHVGSGPFDVALDRVVRRPFLRNDQIAEGGFPVRSAFFQTFSLEEIQGLREKWKVAPDAQVVVVLGGGFSVNGAYAEEIAKHYKKQRGPNIHIFVICGNNREEQARLTQSVGTGTRDLPISIRGWTTDTELSELYSLAASPNRHGLEGAVISAKGGGGTIAEMVVKNVRVVANNDIPGPLAWERFNLKTYCVDADMGALFEKDGEMLPALFKLLASPKTPSRINFNADTSIARSMEISSRLVSDAEGDRRFQKLRRDVDRTA